MLEHRIIPPERAPRGPGFHCLVLHGLGDSMHGWMPAIPLFALPELGWAFADAPEPYGPYGGFSWFDLLPDMTPDAAGVHASRALLAELVDHLLARLAIPAERLFLLGFSQGSLIALDAALTGPHRFAGVIGISGWVHDLDAYPAAFGPAARAQRILMTHGTFDELLPIELVRDQAQRLRAAGAQVEWREYDKAHTLDPEREARDIGAFIRARMAAKPA